MTKENKLLKRLFKQKPPPKINSLSDVPRQTCKAYFEDGKRVYDYEGLVEYGFLPINMWAWDDEDIKEYLDEEMWQDICSPYDCTGKLFTQYICFHRNPNGSVSFVHSMGLDV